MIELENVRTRTTMDYDTLMIRVSMTATFNNQPFCCVSIVDETVWSDDLYKAHVLKQMRHEIEDQIDRLGLDKEVQSLRLLSQEQDDARTFRRVLLQMIAEQQARDFAATGNLISATTSVFAKELAGRANWLHEGF